MKEQRMSDKGYSFAQINISSTWLAVGDRLPYMINSLL